MNAQTSFLTVYCGISRVSVSGSWVIGDVPFVLSHSSIATRSYVWPSAAVTGFLRRPACFYGQPCAEVCGFNFPKVFTENPARFFHIDVDLLLCYNSPWATLARDAEEGDAPHGHLSGQPGH